MIRALLVLLVLWAASVEAAPCDIQPIEIAATALTTTPNTVIYTVPTGKKVVVSSILVASNATGVTVRNVTIGGVFGGTTINWLAAFGQSANQSEAIMTGIVLNAGRDIVAWQGVGTDVHVTISGGLYTCPP